MRRGVAEIVAFAAAVTVARGGVAGAAEGKGARKPAAPAAPTVEKIAILDVVVEGVTADARARFEASLEEGLRGAGLEVVPYATVQGLVLKSDVPEGCSFGPCTIAVGKTIGARRALVARITAEGSSFSFVLTIVDLSTGLPSAQVADTCPVCTFEEATASATMNIVSLATGAGDQVVKPGELVDAKAAEKGLAARGRVARKAAWWMTGLAVVAAGAGAVLEAGGHDTPAWAGFGAAGGFAVAGITLFEISSP